MSAKQAINDKLQGSVAAFLRGVVGLLMTKLRKVYWWVCEWKKFNRWIFGKVTSKNVIVSCTCALGQHTAKRRRKCTKQSRSCCNFAKYSLNLCWTRHCRQHLRSAGCHQLFVPRHRRSMFGRRAFSVAGPAAWNSLQTTCEIRHVPSTVFAGTWKRFFSTFLLAYTAVLRFRGFASMRYINHRCK